MGPRELSRDRNSRSSILIGNYGLETVVSVLFSNTRTRLLYNEREIFNTARSEAECSIENFEFIVQ